MRKINVLSFITLDGVMQGPGGGFTHGGWLVPFFDDFVGYRLCQIITGQTKSL